MSWMQPPESQEEYDHMELVEDLGQEIQQLQREVEEQNKTANHYREETLRLRAQVQAADELLACSKRLVEYVRDDHCHPHALHSQATATEVAYKAYQLTHLISRLST